MEADRVDGYANNASIQRNDLVLESKTHRLLRRLFVVIDHRARHVTRHQPPLRIVRTVGESFEDDVKACRTARHRKLRRRRREER